MKKIMNDIMIFIYQIYFYEEIEIFLEFLEFSGNFRGFNLYEEIKKK